jgi:hypothetical protein
MITGLLASLSLMIRAFSSAERFGRGAGDGLDAGRLFEFCNFFLSLLSLDILLSASIKNILIIISPPNDKSKILNPKHLTR